MPDTINGAQIQVFPHRTAFCSCASWPAGRRYDAAAVVFVGALPLAIASGVTDLTAAAPYTIMARKSRQTRTADDKYDLTAKHRKLRFILAKCQRKRAELLQNNAVQLRFAWNIEGAALHGQYMKTY